jgi:hypothetical protein
VDERAGSERTDQHARDEVPHDHGHAQPLEQDRRESGGSKNQREIAQEVVGRSGSHAGL